MSYNSTSFRYLVVERAAEGPSGPINQWHHLAGVWDGEQISLYVNGQLTQSQPARGFVLNSKNLDDHRGRIGRHAKPDRSIARYFSGTLDDFAIFAGALTPEQVQAVYRQGLVEAMK